MSVKSGISSVVSIYIGNCKLKSLSVHFNAMFIECLVNGLFYFVFLTISNDKEND